MSFRPMLFRVALTSTLALVLAGCREDAGPDVAEGPIFVPAAGVETYALAPAPAWQELPAAPPAPVGRPVSYDDGYGYAERAYAMDRAFDDSPPDYGFVYDDAEPWVWRTDDDYMLFVEPIDGGYRRYYYEPGASYPYYVRDPDYGYGYDRGGVLVSVYNPSGALLPHSYLDHGAIRAGRYRGRGRVLYETAVYERRLPIARQAWVSRRPNLVASQRPWMEAAVRQKDWRKYRERHDHKEIRKFVGERERRKAMVARAERDDFRRVSNVRDHQDRGRKDGRWDEPDRRASPASPRVERPVREERARPERPERADRPTRVNAERPRGDQPGFERGGEAAKPARAQHAVREERGSRARPERAAEGERPRGEQARPDRVARAEARQPARVEQRREERRPDVESRQEAKEARGRAEVRREERAGRPERVARSEVREEGRRPERAERQSPRPRPEQQARVERPVRSAPSGGERPQRAERRAEAPAGDRSRGKPETRQRAEGAEATGRDRGGERGGGKD